MIRKHLLPDWQRILRRAWSVRLMLLAGLLTGGEAVINFVGVDAIPMPTWLRMVLISGVIGGAFVTRLLVQRDSDAQ